MSRCRFCQAPLELTLVDLGNQPLANSYLKNQDQPEKRYPLHAKVCSACFLVQVDDVVPAEEIFSDYAYFSSYSPSWVNHAKAYAAAMADRFNLNASSKVVEIASNDGYLLQHFVSAGIPTLGVEPANNVAETARAKGIPTETAFFNEQTAKRLLDAGHQADLMVANNVIAHVPDINSFVRGFTVLLKPDGVLTIEFPHVLNLLELVQFDTIYHEHFSYLSLLCAERVLKAHGLRVFDVEELPTHGGSLRIFACHENSSVHNEAHGLISVRAKEAVARLDKIDTYLGYEDKVFAVRDGLVEFVNSAKAQGKSIAAYGAAAKGNTLLNYAGIDATQIDYVVDANVHKQGRFLPGSRIPIFAPEHIYQTQPDYVLVLPWNLRDEIIAAMKGIRAWGGKFVTAIPRVLVL